MTNCLIQPKTESKKEFLLSFGERVNYYSSVLYHSEAPDPSLLFVLLELHDGVSTAKIAYSNKELRKLKIPKQGNTIWFLVSREDLYNVSDLENYLPKDQIYE